ncbi:MAG: hypothetical protein IH628_03885, partial [Proteobacteria bacterium]|nr:hypothetical protein [Pseudomonadota bacterium]
MQILHLECNFCTEGKGCQAFQYHPFAQRVHPSDQTEERLSRNLDDRKFKAWEDGEIVHGHLEQLVRVSDPKELKQLFDAVINQELSVKRLRQHIEARTPKLSCALFDKEASGCSACPKNTDVQRSLFGEDTATKALCLDQACYG